MKVSAAPYCSLKTAQKKQENLNKGDIVNSCHDVFHTERFSRGITDEMKSFSLAQILWSAAETNRTHSRAMWRICRQRQSGKDAQDGGLNESVIPNSKLG